MDIEKFGKKSICIWFYKLLSVVLLLLFVEPGVWATVIFFMTFFLSLMGKELLPPQKI